MNSIYIAVHILKHIFDWNEYHFNLTIVIVNLFFQIILPKVKNFIVTIFFHLDRGFELTYRSSDDSSLQIVKYGEYIYDHIILFAPATKGNRKFLCFFLVFIFFFTEFGGRLDAEALTEFVDAGGNILVAGSNLIGKNIIYIFHSIQ
jgi:hypothetical protein